MYTFLNHAFCDIAWEPETTRITMATNADGSIAPLSDQTSQIFTILLIAAVVLLVIVAAAIIISLSVKARKVSAELSQAETSAFAAATLSGAVAAVTSATAADASAPAAATDEAPADNQ